jgi:segregation and condensation protein A
MKRIHARLVGSESVSFAELFEPGMHKSAMVGVFLAVLELTRHHSVIAKQKDLHSPITLVTSDQFSDQLDVSNIDDYNPHSMAMKPGDPGSMVE